jgi:soluble cytochrome b562
MTVRNRLIVIAPVFAMALMLGGALLRGADEPAPAAATPAPDHGAHGPDSSAEANDPKALHRHMEAINRDLQKITRNVKDAKKNDQSLAAVQDMQVHTVAAKAMTPTANAATRPEAERPAYIQEFRRQMVDVLHAELDLERQLLDGKNDDAAQTVKKLRELEKKGHKDYRPPESEK